MSDHAHAEVQVERPPATRRAPVPLAPAAQVTRRLLATVTGRRDGYRVRVLYTMSWLIRAGAFVAIGIDAFTNAHGPVAVPVAIAAYSLCGLLLTLRVVVDRRRRGATGLPFILGAITVAAGAVAPQANLTSMVGLALIGTIDAASESRLVVGWGVLCAGIMAVSGGALVADATAEKTLVLLLTIGFGTLTGLNRRAYRVRAEQSAALLAQAEELRAEQRRGAVLDERTRIAREIHDILAHSLGALGIQIQAARALLADVPETGRADNVLAVAQRMASDGLTETRRAVHALRADTLPLDEELTLMSSAHEQRHGVPVTVEVTGERSRLPAGHIIALVRAAQESLVNTAKHAPLQPVTITLTYRDEKLTMTIANPLEKAADPRGFATLDSGYGLTGMRERLLLLGGTLSAGPAGGTWTVTAEVPR